MAFLTIGCIIIGTLLDRCSKGFNYPILLKKTKHKNNLSIHRTLVRSIQVFPPPSCFPSFLFTNFQQTHDQTVLENELYNTSIQ